MVDPASPPKRSLFVRSIYAGRDIELFLVTAIATILIVRAALAATGWPQLGGGKIHFAHLLWGGLAMLLGLLLFMAMQGRRWKLFATFASGVGFGLFLDELGKFITSDNDYFFKPAVAIMYLVFVVLFLVVRAIDRTAALSPQSALVNALDVVKEAVILDLDETERAQALHLLAMSDQHDPLVAGLRQLLSGVHHPEEAPPSRVAAFKLRVQRFYGRLVAKRWFKALVLAYLGVVAAVGVLYAVLMVVVAATGSSSVVNLDFWTLGLLVSTTVSAVLIVIGMVRWRRSRMAAYRWFQRALLVSILISQFFSFYQNQVTQAFGLAVVLLTYAAIRGMTKQEEQREKEAPCP